MVCGVEFGPNGPCGDRPTLVSVVREGRERERGREGEREMERGGRREIKRKKGERY